MVEKIKNICLIVVSLALVFGIGITGIATEDREFSDKERRLLAGAPEVTKDTLLDGSFMDSYESYIYDQIPGRDAFLDIKSFAARNLFFMRDDGGYYKKEGHLSQISFPLDEGKVRGNLEALSGIYEKYIAGRGCETYVSFIPDKNFFFMDEGYPHMDYDFFSDAAKEEMDFAREVPIMDKLSLSDYYRTDPHWRQEKILGVAESLLASMGGDFSDCFSENELDDPFYGALYSQSGISAEADSISYLTWDGISDVKVTGYETGKGEELPVYNMEKASGKDPYDLFLSGAQSLLEIENPGASSDKELVVFRDSFASSLIPLLIPSYKKITVVDIRYLNKDFLGSFVEFNGQDVLFLYSTLTLNTTVF